MVSWPHMRMRTRTFTSSSNSHEQIEHSDMEAEAAVTEAAEEDGDDDEAARPPCLAMYALSIGSYSATRCVATVRAAATHSDLVEHASIHAAVVHRRGTSDAQSAAAAWLAAAARASTSAADGGVPDTEDDDEEDDGGGGGGGGGGAAARAEIDCALPPPPPPPPGAANDGGALCCRGAWANERHDRLHHAEYVDIRASQKRGFAPQCAHGCAGPAPPHMRHTSFAPGLNMVHAPHAHCASGTTAAPAGAPVPPPSTRCTLLALRMLVAVAAVRDATTSWRRANAAVAACLGVRHA